MEDCNMLAADCVVISCCCQCLMLQLLIFMLIKLPCKIARRTKKFARKKLGLIPCRNKRKKVKRDHIIRFDDIERIQVEEFGSGNCMEEVERILEELSQKGEFSFGSFWGRNSSPSACIHDHVDKQDISVDFSVAQFEFVELLHYFPCSN
ncbi:hypothetical protein M5689_016959 [Euphorbia peplus]|nr:hypothetical protein M5689_016959 [Euphorbia peplus]